MSTDLVTAFETIPAAFRVSWYGGKPPEVDRSTPLVPVADCQRIIATYEGVRAYPASESEAAKTAKDLFDAWPQKKPENMRVLFKVVKEAFMTIPYGLHGKVFTILTNREEFLPNKAKVVKAIDEVTEPLLCASIMARKHLAEHQKRAAQSTPRLADNSVNLKQRLKDMPETSELAAVLCGTLCRLEGRDPLTDADLAERKEAMRRQIAAAEPSDVPAVSKPLSPEAQARRDMLMQSLAEKRPKAMERAGI